MSGLNIPRADMAISTWWHAIKVASKEYDQTKRLVMVDTVPEGIGPLANPIEASIEIFRLKLIGLTWATSRVWK